MTRLDLNILSRVVEKFAQSTETDSSLVDSIKKAVGMSILDVTNKLFDTKAVSSISIRIIYSKPTAVFEISATGSDAAAVNQELKTILDKKFSPTISKIIITKDPAINNFNFGLFTVESA